ncbi:NAD-dependent protein deacetylase [Kocuria dechangensis]|uniref:protein acetyllysine N-acetyltransferase n=1 Tax=Kocuria dechangensis TaxID=1176249 RepID=A0A917LX52_9MICC|nr:NAD-dependent protein deacetylase [Kocuria dechangensis]GGG64828.1 NAD-dependent protein deacetylase [Kocuria dechangensis]
MRTVRAGYGVPDSPDQFPDPDAADLATGLVTAVELLRGRRTAVLTGAGISTDSGIPDYRGPGSTPRTPMTFQEFMGSAAKRSHYWARNQYGWRHLAEAQPNAGHLSLARLEGAGAVTGIVTQNIDRLHQAAGSLNVVDLHGRYTQVRCMACGTRIPRAVLSDLLDELNPGFYDSLSSPADIEYAPDADAVITRTAGFRVPDCPVCGGVLKPDVVFFGENAPRHRVLRALRMVDTAEALLVVGSSLTVNSGRRFVRHAVRHDRPVVIVNHGRTRGDAAARLKIDARSTEFLVRLEQELTRP